MMGASTGSPWWGHRGPSEGGQGPLAEAGLVTFAEASVGQAVLDMPQITPQWQGLHAGGSASEAVPCPGAARGQNTYDVSPGGWCGGARLWGQGPCGCGCGQSGDGKRGGRGGSPMGMRVAGMPFKTIISLGVPTASFTL